MTKRKIYLASSWKNERFLRVLGRILKEYGHEVFNFCDPENYVPGIDPFCFSAETWTGKPLNEIGWLEFNECEATKRAFKVDRAGLDWADTVVLVLPCGRSAHMEAGYAVGKGKDLFIWGELPPGEFETMYGFAVACFDVPDLEILIKRLEAPPL